MSIPVGVLPLMSFSLHLFFQGATHPISDEFNSSRSRVSFFRTRFPKHAKGGFLFLEHRMERPSLYACSPGPGPPSPVCLCCVLQFFPPFCCVSPFVGASFPSTLSSASLSHFVLQVLSPSISPPSFFFITVFFRSLFPLSQDVLFLRRLFCCGALFVLPGVAHICSG